MPEVPTNTADVTAPAATEWLTDAQQRAWRGLLQMTSVLNARLNRELQTASSLSLADYDVLVQLSETPGARMRVSELAHSLQWEQSRLSHHLARMETRGLVAREACPTDRRGAFADLTPAGAEAIAQAAPAHVAQVRRLVFDGLSDRDVAALERTSSAVIGALETTAPSS